MPTCTILECLLWVWSFDFLLDLRVCHRRDLTSSTVSQNKNSWWVSSQSPSDEASAAVVLNECDVPLNSSVYTHRLLQLSSSVGHCRKLKHKTYISSPPRLREHWRRDVRKAVKAGGKSEVLHSNFLQIEMFYPGGRFRKTPRVYGPYKVQEINNPQVWGSFWNLKDS